MIRRAQRHKMKIKINDTYHETKIDFDFLFLFDIVNLARVKGGTLQSLSIRSEREDRPKSKYFSQYDDWEMMLCPSILPKASCCYTAVANSQSPVYRRLFFYFRHKCVNF